MQRQFFMLYHGSLSFLGLQWAEVGWMQIAPADAAELVTAIARGALDPGQQALDFWALVDQNGVPVFPSGQVLPTGPLPLPL